MFKIRTSKFRHVFCDQPKQEELWTEFRLSTVTGDQQYVKASGKYFAVGMAGGGGPICVNRLDRPGRFEAGLSGFVSGHGGAVNDIDWNPFDDSMMATASEDTHIKLWSIPDDWEPVDEKGHAKKGEELKESVADLKGHRKKVTLLRFHPTASNVLISTSADHTVRVWDAEQCAEICSVEDVPGLVHDVVWDQRGDKMAYTCKDKAIRICDPRTGKESHKIAQAHDGVKSVKMNFVNDTGKIFTYGSSKTSSREIRVWDINDLSKPLHTESIDTAAGGLIPLWDPDTHVLYLCGKGDGIVRLYEYEDKAPFIFKLNDGFKSNIPGKGYCTVPKRGLEIMKHETTRILKVTSNNGVHPLHFFVPRKSDAFQDDIFPDTAAATPAHTAAEWIGGSSKDPVKMSLDPAVTGQKVESSAPKKAFKSVAVLSKELDAANSRIKMLEEKLKANNIDF